MYVVCALFENNSPEQFRKEILVNAAASLRDEPGCHKFDVSFAEGDRQCFLYELYDDEAAFQAHLKSPHFAVFSRAVATITTHKRVEFFALADNPPAL